MFAVIYATILYIAVIVTAGPSFLYITLIIGGVTSVLQEYEDGGDAYVLSFLSSWPAVFLRNV